MVTARMIAPSRNDSIACPSAVARMLRAFGAKSVYYSVAGVRDGIIADLAARRVGAQLARLDKEQRRIVETMARRFGVDVRHARKTAELAGTVKGDVIEFSFEAAIGDQKGKIIYTGKINAADKMNGAVEFTGIGKGTWKGTKQ